MYRPCQRWPVATRVIPVVAVLAVRGWHAHASAALTVFTDKNLFLVQTEASSATGPLPNLGKIPGGPDGTATVGRITFSIAPPSANFSIGAGDNPNVRNGDFTLLTPGHDIGLGGVENLNIAVDGPVFALGFDFVEPGRPDCYTTPCSDSTFTVTLKDGEATVGTFTFNAPNDVLAFVGVWSDTPFRRVEIRDTTATIDNEYFGEVFTGTRAADPAEWGIDTWVRVANNGLDADASRVEALAIFRSSVYLGTFNRSGPLIFRASLSSDSSWSMVIPSSRASPSVETRSLLWSWSAMSSLWAPMTETLYATLRLEPGFGSPAGPGPFLLWQRTTDQLPPRDAMCCAA
jgi:hypothetical protein